MTDTSRLLEAKARLTEALDAGQQRLETYCRNANVGAVTEINPNRSAGARREQRRDQRRARLSLAEAKQPQLRPSFAGSGFDSPAPRTDGWPCLDAWTACLSMADFGGEIALICTKE